MSPHEALMPANSEKFMGDQLHRLDMRKGKFSRGAFYASAAGYFMSPSPAAAWTMASVNAYYRAESKNRISDKCIYNQLDKYEALPGAELVVKTDAQRPGEAAAQEGEDLRQALWGSGRPVPQNGRFGHRHLRRLRGAGDPLRALGHRGPGERVLRQIPAKG